MDIDKDFIKHWMQAGETIDVVNQFVCYFIIFNYLYEAYHYQRDQYSSNSDRSKIKRCLAYINRRIDFNPFLQLSKHSELIKMPVCEVRNGRKVTSEYDNTVHMDDLRIQNIQNLFMNIYQVRCNLFHGCKDMICLRDKGLVKESAEVLKLFLQSYLKSIKM